MYSNSLKWKLNAPFSAKHAHTHSAHEIVLNILEYFQFAFDKLNSIGLCVFVRSLANCFMATNIDGKTPVEIN